MGGAPIGGACSRFQGSSSWKPSFHSHPSTRTTPTTRVMQHGSPPAASRLAATQAHDFPTPTGTTGARWLPCRTNRRVGLCARVDQATIVACGRGRIEDASLPRATDPDRVPSLILFDRSEPIFFSRLGRFSRFRLLYQANLGVPVSAREFESFWTRCCDWTLLWQPCLPRGLLSTWVIMERGMGSSWLGGSTYEGQHEGEFTGVDDFRSLLLEGFVSKVELKVVSLLLSGLSCIYWISP